MICNKIQLYLKNDYSWIRMHHVEVLMTLVENRISDKAFVFFNCLILLSDSDLNLFS